MKAATADEMGPEAALAASSLSGVTQQKLMQHTGL